MLHRDKHIGHSLYRVVKHDNIFRIMEIYNDGTSFVKTYSPDKWDHVEDALIMLSMIGCEQYYTDRSRAFCF